MQNYYIAGDGGGGSRLEAKKNLPTLGTNFNPGPPLGMSANVTLFVPVVATHYTTEGPLKAHP